MVQQHSWFLTKLRTFQTWVYFILYYQKLLFYCQKFLSLLNSQFCCCCNHNLSDEIFKEIFILQISSNKVKKDFHFWNLSSNIDLKFFVSNDKCNEWAKIHKKWGSIIRFIICGYFCLRSCSFPSNYTLCAFLHVSEKPLSVFKWKIHCIVWWNQTYMKSDKFVLILGDDLKIYLCRSFSS